MPTVGTAVIRCPDPRGNGLVQQALKRSLGIGSLEYAETTAFGGALTVELTESWIRESIRLLGVRTLAIITHLDCKAIQDQHGETNQDWCISLLQSKGRWAKITFPELDRVRLFLMPDDGQGNLIAELAEYPLS